MEVSTTQLKQLLVDTFELDTNPAEITDDTGIIGHGLDLDSVDMLEIISQIDKKFGVRIKNENIKKEYFTSILNLTNFINTSRANN